MAQQTAVEWLEDNLIGNPFSEKDFAHNVNIFQQAKAMEKEQIKNSFNNGYCKGDEELSWYDIEKYYNETYNK
jgi:hypothetical protein